MQSNSGQQELSESELLGRISVESNPTKQMELVKKLFLIYDRRKLKAKSATNQS